MKENNYFFKNIEEIDEVLASFVDILNMNFIFQIGKIFEKYKQQKSNIDIISDNFSVISDFLKKKGINLSV